MSYITNQNNIKKWAKLYTSSLSTGKKLQKSKLNLLKFNHSKTRTTSHHKCAPVKIIYQSNPENNSWICCSHCNQWWHFSCAQILSKDLVKYFKYHILYSCSFFVVKEACSCLVISLLHLMHVIACAHTRRK